MTPVVLPIAPEAMPEGGAPETGRSGATEGSRFGASLAKAISHRDAEPGRETDAREPKENSPDWAPHSLPSQTSPQNGDMPRAPALPPDFIPDEGEFPNGSEMNAYAFAPSAAAETLPVPNLSSGHAGGNAVPAPVRMEIPGLPYGPLQAPVPPAAVPVPTGPANPVLPGAPLPDSLPGPNPGPLPVLPPLDTAPGVESIPGRTEPMTRFAIPPSGVDRIRLQGENGQERSAPAIGLPLAMPGAAMPGAPGIEGAFPAPGIPGPSAREMMNALTAGLSARMSQPEGKELKAPLSQELAPESEPEAALKPASAISGNASSGNLPDSGMSDSDADPRAGMARLEKPPSAPAAPPPFERAPARTALTHLPSALLLHMVQSAARGGSLAVLGRDEIFVQLEPAHLGRVQVAMETQQGRVMARIGVENETVRQMVENQLPALRQSLEQQGVRVEGLEVQVQDRHTSLLNPEGQNAESFFQRRRPGGSEGNGGAGDGAEMEADVLAGAETGRRWGFNTVEYIA